MLSSLRPIVAGRRGINVASLVLPGAAGLMCVMGAFSTSSHATSSAAVAEPLEQRALLSGDAPAVLFIRGADRSGGFLEANNDADRTEQLADINNASTTPGNHGWATLAQTLRGEGYVVTQITETAETQTGPADGVAIDLTALDLRQYHAIVFGSNNAVYSEASIDALEAWVKFDGGAALFISDANFGSNWRDASDSDQQFLDRFGMTMNQDRGTYAVERSASDYMWGTHPILAGVDKFDGEGVTPVTITTVADGNPPIGVFPYVVARAKDGTRSNDGQNPGNQFRGTDRAVTTADASLAVAGAVRGRVAVYFDRNTFFNANGAGTDITRFDNRKLATNLFGWLTANRPQPIEEPAATPAAFRVAPVSQINDDAEKDRLAAQILK